MIDINEYKHQKHLKHLDELDEERDVIMSEIEREEIRLKNGGKKTKTKDDYLDYIEALCRMTREVTEYTDEFLRERELKAQKER